MGRDQSVCRVIVLGSTGSIGTQTLDVIAHLNALHERGVWATRYDIVGLAARNNTALLTEQAARFDVSNVARCSSVVGVSFCRETCTGQATQASVWDGEGAAEQLIREVECDIVVAAISGIAGLPATLAAVELGRDVALANKETLVAAGAVVIPAAGKSGSRLLPVDSEHSGVWQCLAGRHEVGAPPFGIGDDVRRIVLTASGGPFRTWTQERIAAATVEEALKHPTWSMGRKVTIDSATLMNKGLEVIEARWLFGVGADRIEVVVHPQSVVHSMVELVDGSLIAQLGVTDMRLPIQYAFSYPDRWPAPVPPLDLARPRQLDFDVPDTEVFPCLALAYRALRGEGSLAVVLNAANEVAVALFLDGALGFTDIARVIALTLDRHRPEEVATLAQVRALDGWARDAAADIARGLQLKV